MNLTIRIIGCIKRETNCAGIQFVSFVPTDIGFFTLPKNTRNFTLLGLVWTNPVEWSSLPPVQPLGHVELRIPVFSVEMNFVQHFSFDRNCTYCTDRNSTRGGSKFHTG